MPLRHTLVKSIYIYIYIYEADGEWRRAMRNLESVVRKKTFSLPQRLYHKLPRAERDPSRTNKKKSKTKRCNLLNDALRIFASASELQLRDITKVVGKVLCKQLE